MQDVLLIVGLLQGSGRAFTAHPRRSEIIRPELDLDNTSERIMRFLPSPSMLVHLTKNRSLVNTDRHHVSTSTHVRLASRVHHDYQDGLSVSSYLGPRRRQDYAQDCRSHGG